MTPEQIRIAMAEVDGWIYQPEHDVEFNTPAGKVFPESWRKETDDEDITSCFDGLPNYPEDLNAVHEVEMKLSPEQLANYEQQMISRYGFVKGMTATAHQRCEAILRILGKWI